MKSLLLSILALFLAEWYIRQGSGEAPRPTENPDTGGSPFPQ